MILSSLGPVDSEPPRTERPCEERQPVTERETANTGTPANGAGGPLTGAATGLRDEASGSEYRFGGKAEGGRQEERNIGNAAAPITKRTTEYEIEQSVAPL